MRLEGKISPLPIALYGKSSAIGEPVFLVGKIYGSVTACAINFERNAVSLSRPKDEFFFRPTAFLNSKPVFRYILLLNRKPMVS